MWIREQRFVWLVLEGHLKGRGLYDPILILMVVSRLPNNQVKMRPRQGRRGEREENLYLK